MNINYITPDDLIWLTFFHKTYYEFLVTMVVCGFLIRIYYNVIEAVSARLYYSKEISSVKVLDVLTELVTFLGLLFVENFFATNVTARELLINRIQQII